MLIKGQVVTIEGNDLCATIINKGIVLEIGYTSDDKELNSSEIVAILGKDQATFDFDPNSNINVNAI